MKRKEITIPTILGLVLAIFGLGSGLFLLRGQVRQQVTASAEEAPLEVKISNVTDTGFVVSWVTGISTTGFVQYGEGVGEPQLVVSDERDQQRGATGSYFTHYVPVRGLTPSTTYSFKIGSGRSIYDNSGSAYRVTTGPALASPPAADVAYGQVVSENNEPADGAIVYAELPGAYLQSTLVRSSGSWVLPISTARTANLQSFLIYDKATTTYPLEVNGGPLGKASGVVASANHSPVSQIVLGENFDFSGGVGGEEVVVEPVSRLTVSEELKVVAPEFGERVNTDKPVIFGQAPQGVEVTIEIHSNAKVTGVAVADQTGAFRFSVPQTLEPGVHTITVSAIIDGVVQKVTSSFVVYAAGESNIPYYSATPSASLSPTPRTTSPTPTVTIRLSPTLRPTVSVTPTLIATSSPTRMPPVYNPSTDSALPVSGFGGFTAVAMLVGTVFTLGGAWWWKRTG